MKTVLVALALVMGAQAVYAEPLTYERVPVRVGQAFDYASNSGSTITYKVTGVSAGGYTMEVRSSGTRRSTARAYDADSNVVSVNGRSYVSAKDRRPWKKDVFHLPLVAGKTYATEACIYDHPRKPGVEVTGTPEIVSVEEAPVTVPQGTYPRALKVEVKFRYELTTGYSNYVSETYWFVPGIARAVKMWTRDWGVENDNGTTLELVRISG